MVTNGIAEKADHQSERGRLVVALAIILAMKQKQLLEFELEASINKYQDRGTCSVVNDGCILQL